MQSLDDCDGGDFLVGLLGCCCRVPAASWAMYYRQIYNISRTNSQNSNVSRLVL